MEKIGTSARILQPPAVKRRETWPRSNLSPLNLKDDLDLLVGTKIEFVSKNGFLCDFRANNRYVLIVRL